MKDGLTRTRTLRKMYSSGSIIEHLSHSKSLKEKDSQSLKKNISKEEFFPNDKLAIYKTLESRFVIHPDSAYRTVWNCVLLLAIIYRIFFIPFEVSFFLNNFSGRVGLIVTDVVFFCELVLKLNTGIYYKGVLIVKRLSIIRNYLLGSFMLDFLACFPFQEIGNIKNWKNPEMFSEDYYKLLLIIKLLNIYKLKDIFYHLEDKFTSINSVTFIRFLHFFILSSVLIHWTSCLLHFVYISDMSITGSLWHNYIESVSIRYTSYLYYILFTVTSIGYYSLNIITFSDKLTNITIMFIDIIVFAYILGKIESTLESYQREEKKTSQLISRCKVYLNYYQVPKVLRQKIIRYIQFRREQETKPENNETQVISSLSLPLREEIFTRTRGEILSHFRIFKLYQKTFLKFIGYHLKVFYFGPQDKIFDSGENGSLIYFIQKGSAEIFHLSTSTTFKVLHKGKCFGEISFFLGSVRTASAKSIGFTEVLSLDRRTFNKILNSRPYEKQVTDQLISQTILLGLSVLGVKCYLCKKLGHTAGSCRKFTIKINKKKLNKRTEKAMNEKKKKVNLNDHFKMTFQRHERRVNKRFDLLEIKGKNFEVEEVFKEKQKIVENSKYFWQKKKPLMVFTKGLTIIDEDDSSFEEESSAIPKHLQIRNAFLQNSKRKREESSEETVLLGEKEFSVNYLSVPGREIVK